MQLEFLPYRLAQGRLGCHRRPDRSFFWKGRQFPVCARCTGVILGQCLAMLALLFLPALRSFFPWSLVLLLPMGLDWAAQTFWQVESTNFRRLLTGLLGGWAATQFYFLTARWLLAWT